ncbi:MAG: hypothetical protein QME41_06555 [Actinomycetota bacterium]|nr:hypothetical protein [Actinomycetota bacterium]
MFASLMARHGLKDKELENYADNPTNYIGLRILAMRLGALATKLEVETTEGAR